MREIKFRALDKMGVWWYFTLQDFINKPDCLTDVLEHWCQYTGLKDKNGKEIYFGDILATSNTNPKLDIWNREVYGYTVAEERQDELGVSWSDWAIDTEDDSIIYHQQFVEVIGNIYEHSYLLNDNGIQQKPKNTI